MVIGVHRFTPVASSEGLKLVIVGAVVSALNVLLLNTLSVY